MSFKTFLLVTKNSPKRCFLYMIFVLCSITLIIFTGIDYNLQSDGPELTLENRAILRQKFNNDTISTPLKVGEKVKVLGIERSSYGQKWLVKTQRGDIGWVDASDLSFIKQIITDGKDKGDTVTIKAKWSGHLIHKYTYTNDKGKEKDLSTDDFIPVLEGWADYQLTLSPVTGISTQKKFEHGAMAKSFETINQKYGDPILVHHTRDGFEAQYAWKTFEPTTGMMYRPNVTFGKDSLATAISFSHPTNRASTLLKIMPLSGTILNSNLVSAIIRTNRYNHTYDFTSSLVKKIFKWVLVVVFAFIGFFWIFGGAALPVLLAGWLIKYPKVFYPLSDTHLRILMFVLMIVSWYVWSIVMMAWGMFPIFSILMFIVCWYAYSLAKSSLETKPHCRCPKCRHMYTIHFDQEKFEYSERKKGEDIVRGKLLGKRTSTWEKWTQVTVTEKQGGEVKRTYSERRDVQTMARDYNTYEYIEYDVDYQLDHYREYYICSNCGYVEEITRTNTKELNRKVSGIHTAEVASDVYRKK